MGTTVLPKFCIQHLLLPACLVCLGACSQPINSERQQPSPDTTQEAAQASGITNRKESSEANGTENSDVGNQNTSESIIVAEDVSPSSNKTTKTPHNLTVNDTVINVVQPDQQVTQAPEQILASETGEYTEEEGYIGGFDYYDSQIARTEEIIFLPDEMEKVIGGGTVAAGTVHEYVFTAPPGQQITIELQLELEHEAAFQLQDKLTNDLWSNTLSPYPGIAAQRWSGMLPKSNGEQFRIIVGPTNGMDASYLMQISRDETW